MPGESLRGGELSVPLPVAPEVEGVGDLQLAVDAGSNAFVAFSAVEAQGPRGIYYDVSLDGFSSVRRISLPDCNCSSPSLAVGELAVVQIVFEADFEGESDLFRVSNQGGPFQNPVPVSAREGVAETQPFVWFDPLAQVSALWQEEDEGGTRIVRSTQWGPPAVVAQGARDPVAWVSPRYRRLHLLYRSGDSLFYQLEEEPPVEVFNALPADSRYSVCATGGREIAHVAFTTPEGVWHTEALGEKSFTEPELVIPGCAQPQLVPAPDGTLLLACFREGELLLAVRTEGTWSPPEVLVGGDQSVEAFRFAVDRSGYLHLLAVRRGKLYYQSTVPPPEPSFEATPTEGEIPLTVQFRDLTGGGPVRFRRWDFGDGATSTDRDPVHTYSEVGAYTVTLTVQGPGGTRTLRRENLIVVREASNELRIPLIAVWPGQGGVLHPVYAIHPEPLQGFQLALVFEDRYLADLTVELEGTTVEPLEPELAALSITDGQDGKKQLVYGVVFDINPPFDGKTLPPAPTEKILVFLKYDVSLSAPIGALIPLELRNGIGTPPIDNVFTVVGAQSAMPRLSGGGAFVTRRPECPFVRGDPNFSGAVDLADAIYCLSYLFADGETPPCLDAADSNDSGSIDISDGIYILGYLFGGGSPPPYPFPSGGADPTDDPLPECRCP